MFENGQKEFTIQICHILNAEEAEKYPGTEPKTCENGPKLGLAYLPTSKTSHCVHGTPLRNSATIQLCHAYATKGPRVK